MKRPGTLILALLIAVQFGAVLTLIRSREHILNAGDAFRFKTRPIDPADPFQGRYVSLGFEDDYIPVPNIQATGLRYREPIYARIESDAEGFARFTAWSRERPKTGAYLKTRYLGERGHWDADGRRSASLGLHVDMPFNRFYMEEAKAPRAEAAVREATRSTNCWAVVRILNGKAVVEDVVAKGISLRDLSAQK
jgi:uncharacterized membrane-anchored protein